MRLVYSSGDDRRAFTLIEIMVVVVLIGILSAMIIPEMKGTFEDALLRSTSRDLVNAFGIASSRAVSLNQIYRVRLNPSNGRYVIESRVRETQQGDEFALVKDVSESEGHLDPRISIQMRKPEEAPLDSAGEPAMEGANAKQRSSPDAISFYPDGTADAIELILRDRQGFRIALRINPITGRVKILELERE